MKVIDVDIAVDIARRAVRDSEYGYSYDDLSMEVERDMQSNGLEYNESDTLQGYIDPSDSKDTNNICLIKLKNGTYKIYLEKNIKFHRENIEKYRILKEL